MQTRKDKKLKAPYTGGVIRENKNMRTRKLAYTAEQARDMMPSYRKLAHVAFPAVMAQIIKLAKEDKNFYCINGVAISNEIKSKLEGLGYKVSIGGRFNKVDTYIEW